MKKIHPILFLLTLILIFSTCLISCSKQEETDTNLLTSKAIVSEETKDCLDCHTKKNPSIIETWQRSRHAEEGIGCYECHQAEPGDPDELEHFNEKLIAVIVSPKDCGNCHDTETEQFLDSIHAKAADIQGSQDHFLGEVVEGAAAYISGCQQCHGSKIEVDDGELSAKTWPNFGIGRINPDGSKGACSACHSRHDFSRIQARSPETCGKCHLGPDHPQKEVYEESKHYIRFRSHQDEMNLDSPTWVVGIDYTAAPVCATCHVAATLNQASTHDVGFRISWNNRAEVSFRTEEWKRRRRGMEDVCFSCHNPNYVSLFFQQYDAGIELYNDKFAKPAKKIIEKLKKAKAIDPTPFNETIEWTYFYIWHHDGRQARNGIAMMGPAYVQWHGFNDLAKRFYMELLSDAERLLPNVTKRILDSPEHKWFSKMMSQSD